MTTLESVLVVALCGAVVLAWWRHCDARNGWDLARRQDAALRRHIEEMKENTWKLKN